MWKEKSLVFSGQSHIKCHTERNRQGNPGQTMCREGGDPLAR